MDAAVHKSAQPPTVTSGPPNVQALLSIPPQPAMAKPETPDLPIKRPPAFPQEVMIQDTPITPIAQFGIPHPRPASQPKISRADIMEHEARPLHEVPPGDNPASLHSNARRLELVHEFFLVSRIGIQHSLNPLAARRFRSWC